MASRFAMAKEDSRWVSLGDERPGPRHVKWLKEIQVRRIDAAP
jgi:hypothetical protein